MTVVAASAAISTTRKRPVIRALSRMLRAARTLTMMMQERAVGRGGRSGQTWRRESVTPMADRASATGLVSRLLMAMPKPKVAPSVLPRMVYSPPAWGKAEPSSA